MGAPRWERPGHQDIYSLNTLCWLCLQELPLTPTSSSKAGEEEAALSCLHEPLRVLSSQPAFGEPLPAFSAPELGFVHSVE